LDLGTFYSAGIDLYEISCVPVVVSHHDVELSYKWIQVQIEMKSSFNHRMENSDEFLSHLANDR